MKEFKDTYIRDGDIDFHDTYKEMQNKEKWLDILGYEGIYQVSDLGGVRSLDRISPNGHKLNGKRLKSSIRGKNCKYLSVVLCKNAILKSRLVGDLVIRAFKYPDKKGKDVRYMDGDKLNNKLENLRLKRKGNYIKERTKEILRLCRSGELSVKEIAKMYNLKDKNVRLIRSMYKNRLQEII